MLIIPLAVVASVFPGSSRSKKPNFTGIWQTNLEKSTLRGRPVNQSLVRIAHEEPRIHWEGTALMIESEMKAGGRELRFRDYWFLSSDAQTLTMEHRDDDLAGQISVLEKAPLSAAVRFEKTEK